MRLRLRRRAALTAAVTLAPALLMLLAGCGGGGAQIAVTLTSNVGTSYTPGSSAASFSVTVTNEGPGNATGVVVHVDMPGSFHYKATLSIAGNGNARTTPLAARGGDSSPQWGIWELSAPTSPNGTTTYASVTVNFTVDINAQPNTYSLAGRVVDDDLTNPVVSRPLLLGVNSAPRLGVSAAVTPTSVKAGGMVSYRVTVTNTGTGIAGGVGVLVTLPPVLTFQSSVTPFRGNASRSQPVDPTKGSVVVFYGGFTLPPSTSLGPGYVTIVFVAKASYTPGSGVFAVNVQVTDLGGDTMTIESVAPITFTGGVAPSPSATPVTSPTSSPSPT